MWHVVVLVFVRSIPAILKMGFVDIMTINAHSGELINLESILRETL